MSNTPLFEMTVVEVKPMELPRSQFLDDYLNGEHWRRQVEGFKEADKKLLAILEDELAKGSAPP